MHKKYWKSLWNQLNSFLDLFLERGNIRCNLKTEAVVHSRSIQYSRLIHQKAMAGDSKKLEFINKPDPIVQSVLSLFVVRVLQFVRAKA